MLFSIVLSAWGLALLDYANAQTLSLDVHPTPPKGSSKIIDHSFPSFAIQMNSFPAYSGNETHSNTFSGNLIQTISNKTGSPLVIRVGGTNGDESNFSPTQPEPLTMPPSQTNNPIPKGLVLGPSFFTPFSSSFPGAKFVFSAPMALKNRSDCVMQAQHAVKNIGLKNLDALEVGNEPDLYHAHKQRGANYGPEEYAKEWKRYVTAAEKATGLQGQTKMQGLVLYNRGVEPWTVKNIFEAGVNSEGNIRSVSQHHYEVTASNISGPPSLQSTLMNHKFIANGLDGFKPSLSYLATNHPNIPFLLGEVGRYSPGKREDDKLAGTFASALWTADYLLYAMSLNVTRVNMQQGVLLSHSAWHPIPYGNVKKAVLAPYYGQVFVADFIGAEKNMRIKEVKTGSEQMAAYAGYVGGRLERVAVLNLHVWIEGGGDRGARKVSFEVPQGVQSVKVQKLTAPGGAVAKKGFTWMGKRWTVESDGVAEKVLDDTKTVKAVGGKVEVTVKASEGIMVHMIR